MMRTRLASVLALSLMLIGSPSVGETDEVESLECADAAAAALQQRYELARDLRADIVQTTRAVALGPEPSQQMISTGTVVLAKPGKLRWSYEEPEPSVVVSDGETLWIYDPEYREAQKLSAAEGYMSAAAVQFLLGEGEMKRDFEISALSCASNTAELRLVPRAAAAYEKMHVLLDRNTGDLLRTTVFFVLGNVTEVVFSNIEINRDPTPDTFRLDLPADVRVIELDDLTP